MNLPELCIRRPVMTTLPMAAFVIFGLITYRALPVSELPSVHFPTISVSAKLAGASPETMASAVATPLEGQFSTIAGLDSMSSMSSQGATSITLQFSLDHNIDAAARTSSQRSPAQRKLPPAMPTPPRSARSIRPIRRSFRRPVVPVAALAAGQEYPKRSSHSAFRRSAALPRRSFSARKNEPFGFRRTRGSWQRVIWASTSCKRRLRRPTSISRSASSTAADRPSPSRTTASWRPRASIDR